MSDQQHEDHLQEKYSLTGMMQQLLNDVGGCPYFILGTKIFSSDDIVKKAYRKLSTELHPDKSRNVSELVRDLNTEKLKCINNAKAFLDDRQWKSMYESFVNDSAPSQPFDHSKWSSSLMGKPKQSRFTEPTSVHRVNSYDESYNRAKEWIRQKVDRKNIEKNRDTMALIIHDILYHRHFEIIVNLQECAEIQKELQKVLEHKALMENTPIDFVFLKMFEEYPHIFPLSCMCALGLHDFDQDQCAEEGKDYISKWSKKTDFNRGKDFEYNEYDYIERNSMNENITFIIPLFEDLEHWTAIIRKWIKSNLHFFYVDSHDKSVEKIENSKVIKNIYCSF
jgi:hypothetical protein